MRNFQAQASALAILALLQLSAAVVLFHWALPLFADPPVLGNGISSASRILQEHIAANPAELRHIDWVPKHLVWLFGRHMEGVLFALGAAVALLGSAGVTGFVAYSQLRQKQCVARQGT